MQAAVVATLRLYSAGSIVGAHGLSYPHGMWNLPGPGIELMSLALASEFLTTGPPGKSKLPFFFTTFPSETELESMDLASLPYVLCLPFVSWKNCSKKKICLVREVRTCKNKGNSQRKSNKHSQGLPRRH